MDQDKARVEQIGPGGFDEDPWEKSRLLRSNAYTEYVTVHEEDHEDGGMQYIGRLDRFEMFRTRSPQHAIFLARCTNLMYSVGENTCQDPMRALHNMDPKYLYVIACMEGMPPLNIKTRAAAKESAGSNHLTTSRRGIIRRTLDYLFLK